MPDYPPEIRAAVDAFNHAHSRRGWNKPAPWWAEEVATAMLDAAAPLLGEYVQVDHEHVQADHEVLHRLWELHHRSEHIIATLRPRGWCTSCGQNWPCETRRILVGEEPTLSPGGG